MIASISPAAGVDIVVCRMRWARAVIGRPRRTASTRRGDDGDDDVSMNTCTLRSAYSNPDEESTTRGLAGCVARE
jgi:hypothetical protein